MRLREVMTPAVSTVAKTDTAEAAWETMRREGIGHLVVRLGSGRFGVVTSHDLGGPRGAAVRAGRNVGELMSPSAVTTGPDKTVREAANLMRGHRIGCLPVVERAHLVGIVTVWDLLGALGRGIDRPAAATRRVLRHRGETPRSARAGTLGRAASRK